MSTAEHNRRAATWRRPTLLALLAAYLVLAVAYGLATPILENGDENWHEAAVWQIMAGQGLPVLKPAEHGQVLVPVQEAGQPPLYYLLAAAETFRIHPASPATAMVASPNANIGRPDRSAWHRNLLIPSAAESFPWHGLALAVHLQRMLSTLLGTVTVGAVFALARLAAPQRPALALLATALVAFNPMFLFISASVDNDALAIALSTLILLTLVRALCEGAAPHAALLTGVLLGLATLSKLSAASIALPALVVYGYLAWRGRSRRLAGEYLLALAIPPLLLSGWWFLRNWLLYGDPLGLAMFVRVAGGRAQALTFSGLLSELPSIWDGFWGVFGIFDILLPWPYYAAARVLLALAGLGLLAYLARLVRRRRKPLTAGSLEPSGPLLLLLGGWLLLEALLLVRWTFATQASSGRLLFPALGSVAVLASLGLVTLAGRLQALLSGVLAIVFAGAASLAIPLAIAPAYAAPHFVAIATLQPALPLGYRFGNLELVGATLPPAPLVPGSIVTVTLNWAALGPITQNDVVSLQIFGPGGVRVEDQQHRTDAFPGGGKVLTSRWPAGMGLVDRVPVQLRADVPAPSLVHLDVFVYPDGQQDQPVQARLATGQAIATPEIGRLVYGRAAVAVATTPPLAVFDRQIALQRAGVPATGRPGTVLPVQLHWRALTTPSAAYTVFVHLGPPNQPPLAQHDQQPLNGTLPTTDWVPGEQINDTVLVTLPAILPPGSYAVYAGLYQSATGTRLTLANGATQVQIGAIIISTGGA